MGTLTMIMLPGALCLLLAGTPLAEDAGTAVASETAATAEKAVEEAAAGPGEGTMVTVEDVWPLGEVREYLFEMGGRPMGRQWNQLTAPDDPAESGVYRLDFTLKLSLSAAGQPDSLKMKGVYDLRSDGRPLAYQLDVDIAGEPQRLEIALGDSTIEATVFRDGAESYHTLPRLHDIFLVDNNMIGPWGLMLALIPLANGEPMAGRIFVPQALTEMDILVEIDPGGPVPTPGSEEPAYRCHLAPIGETCWVTPDGRLIRLEDDKQDLVITLLPPQ
jgi:hypothetical protein